MGLAFDWNNERCKFLEQLVLTEGLEARHCAMRIKVEYQLDDAHAPTRNSIIGKAHRMGLHWKKGASKAQASGAARKRTARWRGPTKKQRGLTQSDRATISTIAKLREHVVVTPNLTLVSKQVSLEDLTTDSCRWIDGDPRHGLFCGCKALPGLSYCEGHARRVFDPNSHVIKALTFLDGEQAQKEHAHV